MKRTVIVAIFENDGKLRDSVKYLINQLSNISDYLAIVVNGDIDDELYLRERADKLIFRENKGFDAGAIKQAYFSKEVNRRVKDGDEVVFCNDTFWGPFMDVQKIFDQMSARPKCDFWGLNLSESFLLRFIQSYFLVFGKQVIESGVIDDILTRKIDEKSMDINSILINYERGLFEELIDKGYSYDAYCVQNHHIFDAYDLSIIKDKLPILKKKAFIPKYYDNRRTKNALKYIIDHYDYPIEIILKELKDKHGISITREEIELSEYDIRDEKPIEKTAVSKRDLIVFAKESKGIYIYGAGEIARIITEIIGTDRVKGYVVSEIESSDGTYLDKPVYDFREIDLSKESLIFAMGREYTASAIKNIQSCHRALDLWGLYDVS